MEAALAQATLASGVVDGDDQRSSGEASRGESAVFPSYTFTDVDGVLHTCTVSVCSEGRDALPEVSVQQTPQLKNLLVCPRVVPYSPLWGNPTSNM